MTAMTDTQLKASVAAAIARLYAAMAKVANGDISDRVPAPITVPEIMDRIMGRVITRQATSELIPCAGAFI